MVGLFGIEWVCGWMLEVRVAACKWHDWNGEYVENFKDKWRINFRIKGCFGVYDRTTWFIWRPIDG